MRDVLLTHFPAKTHPLTIVSDPDDLLAGEGVLGVLADRGFAVVEEEDPVLLRVRVEAARPWRPDRPLVVVTRGPLAELPFDLWQGAHRVTLSLAAFFPRLAYPVVRALAPSQRARLTAAPPPPTPLGERASLAHVLRHAFGADPVALGEPVTLAAWLNAHHARREPLPALLRDALLAALGTAPALADLDVPALADDPDAFAGFLRTQWEGYVARATGRAVAEPAAAYVLDFDRDVTLQDDLLGFVRTGALAPVAVGAPDDLPAWTRPAVRPEAVDVADARAGGLLDGLTERLTGDAGSWGWDDWQAVARDWAELTVLLAERAGSRPNARLGEVEDQLDAAFLGWLGRRYAALAVRKLPVPHHVHHVPHLLAAELRRTPSGRVALVVLDGMSLADWQVVAPVWRRRHPGWAMDERLVLAQLPTVTAVSRQALVSGLRPEQFADSIGTTGREPNRWLRHWSNDGLLASAVAYARFSGDDVPPEPEMRVRALCWVVGAIDEIVHGSTLGTAGLLGSLRVWLERTAPALEAGIDRLLELGFTVFLASDHGHVEARGAGTPSEGLAVDTRGRRARTYRDRGLAERAAEQRSGTVLWGDDGLLPADLWSLFPSRREAFAPAGEMIVTHGGPTLDEVVVPLVTLRRR